MKCYLSFILFLCIPLTSFSQTDSTYIGFFKQKLSVMGYFQKDFLWVMQELESGENNTFMPNNPVSIGGGISWNNSVISFSYGYGFDFMRDKKYGKTKSFDFQFHNYGRKFVFDVFIQKYKGFYLDENGDDDKIELFPDMRVEKYGLLTGYIFNNRKFSYKAAFDQNEKQLRSAGSFLVGGGVSYSKMDSDTTIFINDKTNITKFQIGVNGGYAYNWVISRRWFLSGSVTVGMNFGWDEISKIGKQKLDVTPTVFPRISLGYNLEGWSLGFTYLNNISFSSMSDYDSLGISSGNFQLKFIKRIDTGSWFSRKEY